jgi:hypothetical protein
MSPVLRIFRRTSSAVALAVLTATLVAGCDGSDPTAGSCAGALTAPTAPTPTVLIEDRGQPMPPAADSTVDLELSRQYLQQTMQDLAVPVQDDNGQWPPGALEVTGIELGDSGSTATPPPGTLMIHFHPMTNLGNTAQRPAVISTLNYTITTTLQPFLVDGEIVLRLALNSVYSNSGGREIASVDNASGEVTCTDPINAVDEGIVNAAYNSFVRADTTFPMPSKEILGVVSGMLGSTPDLSGFVVTTTSNGIHAGFQFDVPGNISFADEPLLIEQFFGDKADWGIRLSSTFINSQIRASAANSMKPYVTLTGVATHYTPAGIDLVAAGVSNSGGCHIYGSSTVTPNVRVDDLGHRLFTPNTKPKPATGEGEALCAFFNIVLPSWFAGDAELVIIGGSGAGLPYGGCPDAVGGILEFRPFENETKRPRLASQILYASDVAVDDLAGTSDPNDGIFLIGGRVSTLDQAAADAGRPRPDVEHC